MLNILMESGDLNFDTIFKETDSSNVSVNIAFDPLDRYAYTANYGGCSITDLNFDPKSGNLTKIAAASASPTVSVPMRW